MEHVHRPPCILHFNLWPKVSRLRTGERNRVLQAEIKKAHQPFLTTPVQDSQFVSDADPSPSETKQTLVFVEEKKSGNLAPVLSGRQPVKPEKLSQMAQSFINRSFYSEEQPLFTRVN